MRMTCRYLFGAMPLEGRMSYNNKLSARRVNAVADYTMEQGTS